MLTISKKIIVLPLRLKSFINYSRVPKLANTDLEEQFVRGNGPGGSKTNKKANCVMLKHIPTGIVVKCHQARDLHDNRKIARELLITKLDNLINGKNSVQSQIKLREQRKSLIKLQKQNKRNTLKEDWKREGLIENE